MASPRPSLGVLIIISAVDMLLCCFTMGVMLFLVFQPSLSSSQALAKLLNLGGFQPLASGGAGHLATPAVIVIDNLGANRVLANPLPQGYTVPTTIGPTSGVTAAGASGPVVLTAVESPDLAELRLRSPQNGGATLARISVAAHGGFSLKTLDCPRGGELSIDLARNDPIATRCDADETLCPFSPPQVSDKPFDVKPSDVDPESVRVIAVPLHGHPSFGGASICVFSPTYDPTLGNEYSNPVFTSELVKIARACGLEATSVPVLGNPDQTRCIRDAIGERSTWRGVCGLSFNREEARAYFVFTLGTASDQGCKKVQITP